MTTETKFTVGEYKTRDGRRARVYATDGAEPYPVHGAIYEDGEWWHDAWSARGEFMVGRADDVDIMPPLREWWICVTETGSAYAQRKQPSVDNEWFEVIHVREVHDDQQES